MKTWSIGVENSLSIINGNIIVNRFVYRTHITIYWAICDIKQNRKNAKCIQNEFLMMTMMSFR